MSQYQNGCDVPAVRYHLPPYLSVVDVSSTSLLPSLFPVPHLLLLASHPRVLRTCGVPLHKHPGLKEALLDMEKKGIASPFLFSTLANLVEGELREGTADAAGSREKALTVSQGLK